MATPEKICVLIPSYNEARTIGHIVKELRARGLTVYVVDDGSADRTAEIAGSEGAVVVKHDKNKGKGTSLREGFKHILKRAFKAVVVMDGDNQHVAGDIDKFLKRMDETGADIVIGNRMFDTAAMPLSRIYTNRFMSALISMVSGQYVPDTQSGFRLIKTAVLKKIRLESSNFEIESEMVIRAAWAGFKIETVPITTVYQDEKSRINPVVDTLRFIAFMIRILIKR